MRKCPKCGYIDNLLWMQDRFNQSLMFMRIEDFKQEYPDILEQLVTTKKDVIIDDYVYRLTNLYVKRKEYREGESFYPHYEGHARTQQTRAMAHLTKKYNVTRKQKGKQVELASLNLHPTEESK